MVPFLKSNYVVTHFLNPPRRILRDPRVRVCLFKKDAPILYAPKPKEFDVVVVAIKGPEFVDDFDPTPKSSRFLQGFPVSRSLKTRPTHIHIKRTTHSRAMINGQNESRIFSTLLHHRLILTLEPVKKATPPTFVESGVVPYPRNFVSTTELF